MRVMYQRCGGLDVHKKTVVACRRRLTKAGWESEVKTFGTMTADLLALLDWLLAWEVAVVVMESTGEYWKPVFNLLEGTVEVWLVNAQHVKQVPGRKTDVKDAEWLAELLSYGLVRASFIPAQPQRDLRDLTRYRVTLVQERARVVNRVAKLLENANIKLGSVATDILGISGRLMLEALVEGTSQPEAMAELAKGRLRNKMANLEKALTGVVRPHHRFLLAQQLAHLDFLDEQIETLGEEIGQRVTAMNQPPDTPAPPPGQGEVKPTEAGSQPPAVLLSWSQAIELLDTVPGIDRRAAEAMLAEIGLDMNQFPSANHLTAWAGLAPGNNQSGGKRSTSHTRKGNRMVRTLAVQVAHAASRKKGSYLSALYYRIAARRGKKRAIVAVARSIFVSVYHMLLTGQPYDDLGADYFTLRRKEAKADALLRQLTKLGYAVQLEPLPT
ncbi:MAG: IS110 family transposase [Chloroflexi bacterium]|nr:IS110 family transposase [Chloroflexota bacterium]MCI0576524.1 IS110 family transposase [Chloroflexota bacterium]MCI0649839.1 IS110 family transposase [Chloroflexota bacterium]MCI0725122.1 IS110 family transposase [Chloroflexota bacterium]